MKWKIESHRYGIIRRRSRHEPKQSEYKKCPGFMMLTCVKQHLGNIWNSIYGKIKQNKTELREKHCL